MIVGDGVIVTDDRLVFVNRRVKLGTITSWVSEGILNIRNALKNNTNKNANRKKY
jgi:hypothetical protein